MRCVQKRCREPLPQQAKFCYKCGSPQFGVCPYCQKELPLGSATCTDPECNRFLRTCPDCRNPLAFSATSCDNHEWNCNCSHIIDNPEGYISRGGSLARTGCILESAFANGEIGATSTQQPRLRWAYTENQPISSLISGYGYVYFISMDDRCVRRIREDSAVQELSARTPEVMSSSPLNFNRSAQVTELTLCDGMLSLLVTTAQKETGTGYPHGYACCMEADNLEKILEFHDTVQTQVFTQRQWVVITFNNERRQSRLRHYSMDDEMHSVSEVLFPEQQVVDESISPAVAHDVIYFAMKSGLVFRYTLPTHKLDEVKRFDGVDLHIMWMMADDEHVRILCQETGSVNKHLYACTHHEYAGLQMTDFPLTGFAHPVVWQLDRTIYQYDNTSSALRGHNIEDEVYFPTITLPYSKLDNIKSLIFLSRGQRNYVIDLTSRDRMMQVHIRSVEDEQLPRIFLWRKRLADPDMIYSHGRVFLADREEGAIYAVEVFA